MARSCRGLEYRLREAAERHAAHGRYNQDYGKAPLCNGAVGWSGLFQRANPVRQLANRLNMNAVWSIWTAPMSAAKLAQTVKLAALSVAVATPQFARTSLITDRVGRELLVDGLGLGFSDVFDGLDAVLDGIPLSWWGAGKIAAYGIMAGRGRPFIHLDNDLFWWNVPAGLEDKPLIGQNFEYIDNVIAPEHNVYDLSRFSSFSMEHGVPLPTAWLWADSEFGPYRRAINCGVFGGSDSQFIDMYATEVLRLIRDTPFKDFHGQNQPTHGDACVIEQWFLDALACHHGIDVHVIYPSLEASHEVTVTDMTHLLGPFAKSDPDIIRAVDAILARDFPALWRRVADVTARLAHD